MEPVASPAGVMVLKAPFHQTWSALCVPNARHTEPLVVVQVLMLRQVPVSSVVKPPLYQAPIVSGWLLTKRTFEPSAQVPGAVKVVSSSLSPGGGSSGTRIGQVPINPWV